MNSPSRHSYTFRKSVNGEETDNLKLSRVIGLTTLSNASLVATASGSVIYAAGCVAIFYNPQANKQIGFLRVSRAISSLCVSNDGCFVAVGERGHQPCITVWDCSNYQQISSMTGHQHGVGFLKFSQDDHHLVSVGFQHDKQLMVWDWIDCRMISSNKIENKVHGISFHPSGNFFVTCGDRHLKWWYFVKENDPSGKESKVVGVNGRPASILDIQKDSIFVDITCAPPSADRALQSSIYTTTSTGMLCLVHESRLMDKWVQLDSAHSYCLCLTQSLLVVGSSNGKVFVFSPTSLEYLCTLPMPYPLSSSIDDTSKTLYPACYGVCSVPSTSYVACVYADRSLFFWDILDVLSPAKLRSFVFHRACIWDIQFIEASGSAELAVRDPDPLAEGTFATCGADNCVHFWNLDPKQQRKSKWKSRMSRDVLHILDLGVGGGETSSSRLQGTRGGSAEVPDLSCAVPDVELPDRQQVG
jgi:mitogen-activated protein kinase binding protein 1